ncbi:MAG: enoyl-CoA hydratase/isomerase family protein, partial [Acidimicrobiales bacterium]
MSPRTEGEDLLPPQTAHPVVRVVRSAGYAELILNRPARRNALTVPLVDQLRAGLAELGADPAVMAVVVRGEGGCFCSGLDLDQLVGPANARSREIFAAGWL